MTKEIESIYDDAFWDGFTKAIIQVQEKINILRTKKLFNMTADYSWALEDIDTIIKKLAEETL